MGGCRHAWSVPAPRHKPALSQQLALHLSSDRLPQVAISVGLANACRYNALCGTWLWGSLAVRYRRFDPKADLYSLSFIFAEVRKGTAAAMQAVMLFVRF